VDGYGPAMAMDGSVGRGSTVGDLDRPSLSEFRIDPEGIPATVYDPGGGAGLLLLGHGGGRSKDSKRFVELARTYANRTGLVVVCMDAVDHGERKPPNARPGLPPLWHSGAVEQMVGDWQACVGALAHLGSPIAYVGFSMGSIFGVPVVAAIRSIKAAVFVAGGVPDGSEFDDPLLGPLILEAASNLDVPEVLMINMTKDETFSIEGAHAMFDAIPGPSKQLMFWEGRHDDWPDEAIEQSTRFVVTHTG